MNSGSPAVTEVLCFICTSEMLVVKRLRFDTKQVQILAVTHHKLWALEPVHSLSLSLRFLICKVGYYARFTDCCKGHSS